MSDRASLATMSLLEEDFHEDESDRRNSRTSLNKLGCSSKINTRKSTLKSMSENPNTEAATSKSVSDLSGSLSYTHIRGSRDRSNSRERQSSIASAHITRMPPSVRSSYVEEKDHGMGLGAGPVSGVTGGNTLAAMTAVSTSLAGSSSPRRITNNMSEIAEVVQTFMQSSSMQNSVPIKAEASIVNEGDFRVLELAFFG